MATEGVIEGAWLEILAVSFAEDMLPSRSRPRSPIYKDVSLRVLLDIRKMEKPLFLELQPPI